MALTCQRFGPGRPGAPVFIWPIHSNHRVL